MTALAVDVWTAAPASLTAPHLARVLAVLPQEEQEWQRAHAFADDRQEALVTRGLARLVLSRYRDVAPEGWRFSRNAYGRPAIDPECDLRFNLSNHPDLVVCAVCEGHEVGVDVEPLRRGADIVEIASSVFSPAEQASLRALAPAARRDRAVTLWTLKEAYIKARGMGLALRLESFSMSPCADGSATIAFVDPREHASERWTFSTLDVGEHRLSLAVATSEGVRLSVYRLPSLVSLFEPPGPGTAPAPR